jgi:hypothetical protein
MNRDNVPKKFQIHPWIKETENEVKNTLRREEPMGELETPVLRELNPPKNLNIP